MGLYDAYLNVDYYRIVEVLKLLGCAHDKHIRRKLRVLLNSNIIIIGKGCYFRFRTNPDLNLHLHFIEE